MARGLKSGSAKVRLPTHIFYYDYYIPALFPHQKQHLWDISRSMESKISWQIEYHDKVRCDSITGQRFFCTVWQHIAEVLSLTYATILCSFCPQSTTLTWKVFRLSTHFWNFGLNRPISGAEKMDIRIAHKQRNKFFEILKYPVCCWAFFPIIKIVFVLRTDQDRINLDRSHVCLSTLRHGQRSWSQCRRKFA